MNPEDKEKMDSAATEASQEFSQMLLDKGESFEQSVRIVANWWEKHYREAGHKRLGRILLGEASGE